MKRIAAAVVVVVAGAVVAVVAILLVGRDPGAGPLGPNDTGSSWSGFAPMKPGQIAVIGIPLTQGNNLPITLLGVHPFATDNSSGLHIRYAATQGYGLHIGGASGWHTRKWQLRPLAGFVIPAFEPGGIVVGVSASKPRRYFLHGFVVDYKVGDTRYSAAQGVGIKGRFVAPAASRSRG